MVSRKQNLCDRILDQALALGEASGWDAVRLHAVAEALEIPLGEVRACYAQKDGLVEAWFDRADKALLDAKPSPEFLALSARERLQQVIMTWLDALAPHRRLTREMLAYKLEPGHVHLQLLGIMRVSRTVQWFLEAAAEDATGLARIFEEIRVSALYLVTFARWLYDDSPDSRRTRDFLDARLREREAIDNRFERLCKGSPRPQRSAQAPPVPD
ncbi:MAG: TetR/AcrR family transcriptional regulator [Thiogranum sp.]|nr:TetR/AcrR family transcriptional regulator [Thiogranum sp.]